MTFSFLVKENQGKISGHVPVRMICCAEQGSREKGILLTEHRIKLDVMPELGAQLLQPWQLKDGSKRAASAPKSEISPIPSLSFIYWFLLDVRRIRPAVCHFSTSDLRSNVGLHAMAAPFCIPRSCWPCLVCRPPILSLCRQPQRASSLQKKSGLPGDTGALQNKST